MFIDIVERERKVGEERIPASILIHKELLERFGGENPKEEFTPEIMIEYLKHTNIVANVRDMLNLIPEGKEAEFKEAVLSAVERRSAAPINVRKIQEIAERGGFLEDFEEIHKLEKVVPTTAHNHRVFVAKSVDELSNNLDLSKYDYVVCDFDDYKASAKADKIFIANSNEDLEENPDLTKYDMVICDFEGKTYFEDLTKLCKRMIIKGDIDWSRRFFDKLPDISESIVCGDFNCSNCYCIKSLKGAPKKVGGRFDCSDCGNLISLKGAPKYVGGVFDCLMCDKLEERGIYLVQDGHYYDILDLPKDREFVINSNLNLSNMDLEKLPDLSNVIVKGNLFYGKGMANLNVSLDEFPKRVEGNFWYGDSVFIDPVEKFSERVGGDFIKRRRITRRDVARVENEGR